MSRTAFLLQRASAIVLIPLVVGHLVIIVLAVQNGLTGEEILARTRGSLGWGLFYGAFVIAIAVHGVVGVQAVLQEWLGMSRKGAGMAAGLFSIVLVGLGARAIYGVVWG